MFGKDAPPCEQVSEDEDWGPGKRRRREKESEAVNTLMTLHESENKYPNNKSNDRIRGNSSGIKRPCFRFSHEAVEVLIDSYSCCHPSLLLPLKVPTENKYINSCIHTNLCPL